MESKQVLTGCAIVVADRGWVYVGNITHDGEWCVIEKAKNIRRWGTTAGLGQLAESGPTNDTTLDSYGTVRVSAASVICLIETEPEKWAL